MGGFCWFRLVVPFLPASGAPAVRHRFDQPVDFGRPMAIVFGIAALFCHTAASRRGRSAVIDTSMMVPLKGRAANIVMVRAKTCDLLGKEVARFASTWHKQLHACTPTDM